MKTKNIFIIGLLIAASFAACKKDDTNTGSYNPINPNDSNYVDSTRIDYVGLWDCTEVPVAKNQYFDCTILIDSTSGNKIKIKNFANLNATVIARVNNKSVILSKQTISGNTVEGYGNMENKDFITWHYYVKDNTDSMAYNTTFNRK